MDYVKTLYISNIHWGTVTIKMPIVAKLFKQLSCCTGIRNLKIQIFGNIRLR